MKDIELKRLTLTNFKGARNLTVNFNRNTLIQGNNGTFKTTIMDSFLWVLFGKNSEDRKDFEVKTLDSNMKEIPKLEHIVEAEIMDDGTKTVLRRELREIWRTKRGESTEAFHGNETKFFIDDVPMSATDYKIKVGNIIKEDLFKILTNPMYFNELPWKVQRETLIEMAGGINKDDIAAGIPSYVELIQRLGTKPVSDYQKEINEKVKNLKEEIKLNKAKIQEKNRDLEGEPNYDEAQAEMDEKKKQLDSIESKILDISKAYDAEYQKVKDAHAELNDIKNQIANIESETTRLIGVKQAEASQAGTSKAEKIESFQSKIRILQFKVNEGSRLLQGKKDQLENIRKQWEEVNARVFTVDNVADTCTLCGQKLPEEKVEGDKEKLLKQAREQKDRDLSGLNAMGERLKGEIEEDNKGLGLAKAELHELMESIVAVEKLQETPAPKVPTMAEMLELNGDYQDLIQKRDNFTIPQVKDPDYGTLTDQKRALQEAIGSLVAILNQKATFDAHRARKAEIEEQSKSYGNIIASLERDQHSIKLFDTAYMNEVESRINVMFPTVRFKMFKDLINGGYEDTCEATVNGVPYSDLNSAMQMNAGMEIINVLCKFYDTQAPVFVDQAERVIDLYEITPQTIKLVAAPCELTIN